MQPNTQKTQNSALASKKPAGSSKTGAVLSVLALIISAIGYAIANAHFKSQTPVTNASERAGELIAQGTSRSLAVIFSMPLLVAGIALGGLAILLAIVKLRKVKAGGLVMSVVWIALGIWAIKIAIAGFQLIKA
jgi:hypothetical protein